MNGITDRRFLDEAIPSALVWSRPCVTPIAYDLFTRIADPDTSSFLLESPRLGSNQARYSFFGSHPFLTLQGKDDTYTFAGASNTISAQGDPWQTLHRFMQTARGPRQEGLPPFFGGAVGFLSYDLIRRWERLPHLASDDVGTPDLLIGFYDLTAALDHATGLLYLMFAPPLERILGESRDSLYREGCERLSELEARLVVPSPARTPLDWPHSAHLHPDQSGAAYADRARRCLEYIRAGDVYQINLSHRFSLDLTHAFSSHDLGDIALSAYSRLRQVNPSPFGGLFITPDCCLVSSSPERLVRLQGSQVDTRPIAGTRPRGTTLSRDRQLAEELLTNPKEQAEHIMLVDLERNDLGRVCEYGSVRVDELMGLEQYSHVSHIVSNVTGTLRKGLDAFDVLQAVFPGGTVTGVPKVRCMELIESLEPVRRGAYTGSLGYINWSGDLDFNILIRTLTLTKGRGYLHAGAGIVADSIPEREYQETLLKAQAFLDALSTRPHPH
jgi:anthranilate/para-aminobenzoate synthase component I